MKFERRFELNQVPAWASFYLDYKSIKTRIKWHTRRHGTSTDLEGIVSALSEEVSKVEQFYNHRLTVIQHNEALLYKEYGIQGDDRDDAKYARGDPHELEYLKASFLELAEDIRKLEQFVEQNRDGVKRLHHKIQTSQNLSWRHSSQAIRDLPNPKFGNHLTHSQYLRKNRQSAEKLSFFCAERKSTSLHTSLYLENFCLQFYPSFDEVRSTYHAIITNNESLLDHILVRVSNSSTETAKSVLLLLAMLQCAILVGSSKCVGILLRKVQSLEASANTESDLLRLFKLTITLVLQSTTTESEHQNLQKASPAKSSGHDNSYFDVLKLFLVHGQDQTPISSFKISDAIICRDLDQNTLLHTAVLAGSPLLTDLLLSYCARQATDADNSILSSSLQLVVNELLSLAIRSNRLKAVQLLLKYITNINNAEPSGESFLYIASRFGREDMVRILLTTTSYSEIDIDVVENVRGWTPLFIACVEGHLSIVKLLIEAGANQHQLDCFGWTAKEHASFRGYLEIAAMLCSSEVNDQLPRNNSMITVEKLPLLDLITIKDDDNSMERPRSHILVTLGCPNTREEIRGVNLNPYRPDDTGEIPLDHGYMLSVRADGAEASRGENSCSELPRLEDMISQPWHFTTNDPDKCHLVFTIMSRQDDNGKQSVLGSGIAMLQSLKHGLASGREGLARYYTVPILGKDNLEFIGSVTFGLLVVTPPPRGRSIPQSSKQGFWKEGGATQVVGHRGSGANSTARTNLQLGENTIQSYKSAAALGATAVEFDVQLTKDLVPVIFHDFLVMEAGGDTPLYTLRLDQFLHLSKAQTPKGDLSSMAEKRYTERSKNPNEPRSKPRSYSLSVYDDSPSADLTERMKLTESAMEGAHKGNLRGETIHGIFPSFEDLFNQLPDSIAFNVEMKYPMLWEAEDRNMDRYAPEINTYVNLVLEVIYRLAGERSITFSSFSPEVCILLSIKQQDYPVLFLSKAGSVPVGDVRCSGLQQSIRFAKRWNLAGIVILSDPLVMSPRLIGYAKSAGLKVCSYGPLNNDPECAKIQAKAGLDVIIVDKVRLISETLAGTLS